MRPDPTPQPHGATACPEPVERDEPPSGTHGTYRGGWLNGRRVGLQECQATHLESERAWYGIGARIGAPTSFEHGRAAGRQECAETHSDIRRDGVVAGRRGCTAAHDVLEWRAELRATQRGYAAGRRQGAWLALAGLGLLVAVAVRWRRARW